MPLKSSLFASFAVLLAAGAALAEAPIDPARIREDVRVLSSDDFEGRAPASEGEKKTVAYLTQQMKAAGLQPAGDPLPGGGRAWTQDVPLARFQFKAVPTVRIKTGSGVQDLELGKQISLTPTQTGAAALSVKDAPIVFLGYGVSAPERNWDDFKGIDLKGKIGLVLVNDPDYETGKGDFGGKAMTWYGRWPYKFEEAARQGALGFLVVHETAAASYPWEVIGDGYANEVFDVIRKDPTRSHAPVEGWIQHDTTVALLKAAGLDYDALKKSAQTRDFRPAELKGVTFSADGAVDVQKVVSKNVAGAVVGSKHPDEHVLYSGHWDHLGRGKPDASGDDIYNGAVDNAMGTAMVLEVGRAFAKGPKPDRSVVFLAVTAEEQGLLGSEYYAANPLYPLATTVAVLNMDAVHPGGPARDFSTSGSAPLTLQDDLIAVGKAKGRSYATPPRPEAGYFYRSDHFSFAKRGVPALSIENGEDLIDGGSAKGEAAAADYTANRYHKPSDEFDPNWTFDGVAADAELMFTLGSQLANSRVWPEWKTGAEFKAERDKTAAARK